MNVSEYPRMRRVELVEKLGANILGTARGSTLGLRRSRSSMVW